MKAVCRNQSIIKVGGSWYAKLDKKECERNGFKLKDSVDVVIESIRG
jgi:hypothetical protein